MQGNGNDFIVLDNREGFYTSPTLSEWAKRFCQRRQSLGADGILVVERSCNADFTMRLFNADGSEGEMCGNGARCIARYTFEKKIAGAAQSFSTIAGIMKAAVSPPFVDLDMGTVSLENGWFNRSLTVEGRIFPSSFLWVGVPHAVLFCEEELSRNEMIRIGHAVRNNRELFLQGVNVNFARPCGEGRIFSVTYERGVEDLTDSCGTGSTASAIALVLSGDFSPSTATVEAINPGGVNTVTLSFAPDGKKVQASLIGRTVIVAEGGLVEEPE